MRRTADDLRLLMEATGEDKTASLRFTGDFFGVDGLLFELLLFDGDESDYVSLITLLTSSLGGLGRRDNDFVYALGRFLLELFRGDRGDRFGLMGLSVGQLVSIPIFILGVAVLVWAHARKTPADAAGGR